MIKGVHHTAISTRDLDRLRQFYCDVLGFELIRESGWQSGSAAGQRADNIVGLKNTAAKAAMVKKGGAIIEFFEYTSPVPKPADPGWRVCDLGYTHICLEVEDIDAEYERLKKAGMSFHAPPPGEAHGGMRAIYGRDPEGNVIELLEMIHRSVS